jgi:ribose-phosphate pyrophosphokinase
MTAVLHAFTDEEEPARRLAQALGIPLAFVDTHHFPDGELLPRTPPPSPTTLVYRSLDRPNEKLVELLLAAEAWRRNGARRLVLVAPYLCYMRQDAAFSVGEPISQKVVADLLDRTFDRIVTVDPHLHRARHLTDVLAKSESTHLHGADALVTYLRGTLAAPELVVGPDIESEPWVRRIADPLGVSHLTMTKHRQGDAKVAISAPSDFPVAGRSILIADDICSSGATLGAATRIARSAGATSVTVFVTHMLSGEDVVRDILAAGADRVISTDSCRHSTNQVLLADLLAGSLGNEL